MYIMSYTVYSNIHTLIITTYSLYTQYTNICKYRSQSPPLISSIRYIPSMYYYQTHHFSPLVK